MRTFARRQRTVVDRPQTGLNLGPSALGQRPASIHEQGALLLEQRALEQRALKQRALGQRALEQRALEQRGLEQRALAKRALEQRALEQRALLHMPMTTCVAQNGAFRRSVHSRKHWL